MTPADLLHAMRQRQAEMARIASHLDVIETRAAERLGTSEWSDETALAYETCVLTHRTSGPQSPCVSKPNVASVRRQSPKGGQ